MMGRKSVTLGADGSKRFYFIKINASQGYGDKPYQVFEDHGREVTVQIIDKSKPKFRIYKAHTYRDAECIKLSTQLVNEQKNRNDHIGRKR